MTIKELVKEIDKKKSFLCIGLDTDQTKIPKHLLGAEDPVFEFNKAIIDATHQYAVAFKPNIAFYEANGVKGWVSLEKTINYLNDKYPEIFTIADAKRGDIGNTSAMYAKAFFENLNFDSVTVAPYMGKDSVEPFLEYKDKYTILLALTSNGGAYDFQTQIVQQKALYKHILEISKTYQNSNQLMYVVGATKAIHLQEIRKIIPDQFLLVPGIGAQGGNLKEVCIYGMNNQIGLLVNSSRGIIYASDSSDFEEKAAFQARSLKEEMESILHMNKIER